MQSIEGIDEHSLYPIHESETPPPSPGKYWQVHYLTSVVQARLAGACVMSGSCLHYLDEGECICVTPDVVVVSAPPSDLSDRGYVSWIDPPLRFAAEVEGEYTLAWMATGAVPSYVRLLEVPEFLYAHPPTRSRLLLRRSAEGQYDPVPPDASGRHYSEQMNLSLAYDECGFLRLYADEGEELPTYEEQAHRIAVGAERLVEAERRLAELTAELERLRRNGAAPE